jgi:glycosyltransferase involved in cell wall biosynthesis
MKVAILTDNDFAKVNGVTTTLRAVLEHTPDDIDARIYTCADTGLDTDDYLSLPAFGFGIPYYREMNVYVPPVRRLIRHLAADGTDVLHFTTPGPVGLAAIWARHRLGLPMIGSFHTDLEAYASLLSGSPSLGRLRGGYLRWSYSRCERILAPSDATRTMLAHSGIAPSRIDIWRRGVSTTLFDPRKRSAAMRERWGVSDRRPALVYVGRLSKEKGLQALVPITRTLDYGGIAYRLVIVDDGPMRSELRDGCPGAVFTGTLAHEEVAVALASADIFVFPGRTDTAGNVVLEAQASGVPVLVSDVGGPRENLDPGVSGFICRNEIDFARRAAELMRNQNKRRQFGEAARRYAHGRHWEVALEPLYRAYAAAGLECVRPSFGAHAAVAAK